MGSTSDRSKVDVPRGCMAVIVGAEGEQRQRFVIPVTYLKHHLFIELLKEAEEEYGFDQKGPITIPCRVSEFRKVQDSINRERGHHQRDVGDGYNRCFRV